MLLIVVARLGRDVAEVKPLLERLPQKCCWDMLTATAE